MVRLVLYAGAYLSLLPCILLFAGALKKVLTCSCRINRLQLEGAAIITATVTASIFFLYYLIELDAQRETSFAYWFGRGQRGLLFIGTILFCLGFFLERRPRPSLTPWTPRSLSITRLWMGAWLWLAAIVAWRGYSWDILPWGPVGTCLSWSVLCFSIVYVQRAFTLPEDTYRAEGDLLGIEE